MLTIFSTCRSFLHPRFGLLQRNAIGSWLQLKPRPEIIIYGNDPGAKEVCQEFGLIHQPDIECSPQGTPMMHAMFNATYRLASNPTIALISSDIIVFQDTIVAAERLNERFPGFMASVHRHDSYKIDYEINFGDPQWEIKVKDGIALGHPGCGDYFITTKTYYRNGILPFAYGRASCDNWLIAEAIELGNCVDATPCVTIVHPNHDHSHYPGDFWAMVEGEEFKKNRQLAGSKVGFEIRHSNWVMEPDRIRKR